VNYHTRLLYYSLFIVLYKLQLDSRAYQTRNRESIRSFVGGINYRELQLIKFNIVADTISLTFAGYVGRSTDESGLALAVITSSDVRAN